ncbi:helix-turn-helix domain-containing protein [Streptomyces sp. NPDC004284]|uniref:helix-turn-helix domain-containing protein n=1 Tax=Streptomyces sp. NPDC004284 TaxID=3364695 RepID=UPI0036ABE3E0
MAKSKRQEPWEFSGEPLKERHGATGPTQNELDIRVFASGAYIGLFERGIRKPQPDVAVRIEEALQTGSFFEQPVRKPINTSPYASYFTEVAKPALIEPAAEDFRRRARTT